MKRVLLALALFGCASPPVVHETHESSAGAETPAHADAAPPPEEQPPEEAPAPEEALRDGDIPNPCGEGRARLANGQAEIPSMIGLDEPSGLELRPLASGDLDGDGQIELLAYLLCMPGGSGTRDSRRRPVSSDETMCCPTHVTPETWHLEHGQFVRTHVGDTVPY